MVQIYRAQIRAQSQGRSSLRGIRLQPVLPVVFYTGSRSWDAIGSIADLIEMGERFARRTPALEPLFINLAGLEPGRLEGEGGFFGQVLRLLRRRRARPEEFQALLGEVVGRLEAMPEAQRVRWLDLLSYIDAFVYHERARVEHPQLYEVVEGSVRTDEHREEIMAVRQSRVDYLRAEGKKEGKKEGLREGRIRACREMLLRQLSKRFREVPPEVEAAVNRTTDLERLEEWAERFATANKLEDVGIPAAP